MGRSPVPIHGISGQHAREGAVNKEVAVIERIEPGWTHVRDASSERQRRLRRRIGRRHGVTAEDEDEEPVGAPVQVPAALPGPTLDVVA